MTTFREKALLNYGVGEKFSIKLHKILGLNLRNSPNYIKSKHEQKLKIIYLKSPVENVLKKFILNCREFKNKLNLLKKVQTNIKSKKDIKKDIKKSKGKGKILNEKRK